MSIALKALQAEYADLCAKRDRVNAENAPLESILEELNGQIGALMKRRDEIAVQIDTNRGGQAWLDLKRQIGRTASAIMALKRGG